MINNITTNILSSTVGIFTGFNPGLICSGFTGRLGFVEIGGAIWWACLWNTSATAIVGAFDCLGSLFCPRRNSTATSSIQG